MLGSTLDAAGVAPNDPLRAAKWYVLSGNHRAVAQHLLGIGVIGRCVDAAARMRHVFFRGRVRVGVLNAISGRLGLVALLPQRYEQLRGDPPVTSIAAGEYTRPGGVHAYHHAIGRLSNANDHLIALTALICEAKVLPTFAPMTLLRVSYEAALVARWVVDGIPDERLARGIRLHHDDLVERAKFERSLRRLASDPTDDGSDGRSAGERIVELLDLAAPYGIVSTAADGRRSVKPVPSYTTLAEDYPAPSPDEDEDDERNESWFYRFLSAYAHGKQWALILGATGTVHGTSGSIEGRVEADEAWVYSALERVWAHVDAAYSAMEALWTPAGQRRAAGGASAAFADRVLPPLRANDLRFSQAHSLL